MPAAKEVTVHEARTHFSRYSAQLLAGELDQIVVKNRTVPTLRITRYDAPGAASLRFGLARDRGHLVVSDDWDPSDGDEAVEALFEGYL